MSADDWAKYWKGSVGAALTSDGVNHPSIDEFWSQQGRAIKQRAPSVFLDVASGTGSVTEVLSDFLPARCQRYSVDYSFEALQKLRETMPMSSAVCADARSLPFGRNSFELIVSQFGIEYSGKDSVLGLPDYCSNSSMVILLLHDANGAIATDSSESLLCLRHFTQLGILSCAVDLVQAVDTSIATGNMTVYQNSAVDFNARRRELSDKLTALKPCSGLNTVMSILKDFDSMHDRIEFYNRREVCAWLSALDDEMSAYNGRLDSMLRASINNEKLKEYAHHFMQFGFNISCADRLQSTIDSSNLGFKMVAMK